MKRIVVVPVCLLAAVALAAPAGAAVVKAKVAGGTLTVTGTSKANKITLRLKAGAAGKLVVDVGSNGTADFTFNRSSFAAIVVNAGAGNDTVTISEKSGVFTLFENTTLNGGKGTDKLTGGTGAESYVGGTGKDTIASKAGADVFFWTQGDGNDKVDGGADADQLNMNGTAAADGFQLLGAGTRAIAGVGASVLSVATTETIRFSPLGGADSVAVSNAQAQGVQNLQVDLGVSAAGDAQADLVKVNGDAGVNTLTAIAAGTDVQVSGNGTVVTLSHTEAANDRLELSGLGGVDTLSGGALAVLIRLTADGGEGGDTINGGNGADTLIGGEGADTIDGNQGNDTAFLGGGNDLFVWDPGDGSDIVEGQDGFDGLRFNGSAGAEIFAASSNGGRLLFTRNVGNIVMDTDDVELLDLNALGSTDTATVNDLAATDVVLVDVDLGVAGAGDGAADAVTVNGTVGADVVSVSGAGGSVSLAMAAFSVALNNAEPANDTLTINTSSGVDLVNASALAATSVLLTINGGNDGDVLVGSAGNDTVNGDAGNDVIQTLGGNDAMNCGADTDYGDGGAGADTGANCETQVGVP
jgi:Ca2+-binding RTX toxin-like protein